MVRDETQSGLSGWGIADFDKRLYNKNAPIATKQAGHFVATSQNNLHFVFVIVKHLLNFRDTVLFILQLSIKKIKLFIIDTNY